MSKKLTAFAVFVDGELAAGEGAKELRTFPSRSAASHWLTNYHSALRGKTEITKVTISWTPQKQGAKAHKTDGLKPPKKNEKK